MQVVNHMEIENKIKDLLNDLRPYLNSDGGDIEFIKYEDHEVYIKLSGACGDCMFQDDTIQNGILAYIKSEIPEVENIINVPLY